MSKSREKEIAQLLYLKNQLIKETKKEIKDLHQELDQIHGYKTLEKKMTPKKPRYKPDYDDYD